MSKRYRFNWLNIKRAGKVLAWGMATVLVAEVINIVGQFDLPVEYALFLPVINAILFSLLDFVREQAGK